MLPLANILQPLIDVFEPVLVFFHDTVGLGWGFSIVALTVTIRALLLPLTLKQVKSLRGMQQIAPQMKALRDKYKDDPQRMNQEVMKLYRENQVNPFASCLPLLAQLPVFIALFYLLQDDLRRDICPQRQVGLPEGDTRACGESAASNFLFIPDITDNAEGGILILLIVLYVSSQLASSILMATSVDKTQRYIFLALPFIFIPFVINFPAGLLVYWITTNLWTIVQQLIVRRVVGPPPTRAELEANAANAAKATAAGGDGGRRGKARAPRPATATAGAGDNGSAAADGNGTKRRSSAPPPPPPRKKKKQRSGRRR